MNGYPRNIANDAFVFQHQARNQYEKALMNEEEEPLEIADERVKILKKRSDRVLKD